MKPLADFAPYMDRYGPDPMARKCQVELTKPTLDDAVGDVDRLVAALAGTLARDNIPQRTIEVPLGFMRRASRTMREASFHVTAVLAHAGDAWQLIDLLEAPDSQDAQDMDCFGLGVDIGTTTVSLYLVNMTKGEIVDGLAARNPQAAHGEDILSRIHFCETLHGLQTLREMIVGCVNDGARALVQAQGFGHHDIYAVSVAGNPAMMHLFAGLDPYYLCREPYPPVFNRPPVFRAGELMLDTHPDAPVYMFPNLGSYFGGDVVAGILASGMHGKTGVSLLVDVGTNAEIVLGNREWLVVCAGAAGPALESGGAKTGMQAAEGAIERVRLDKQTLEPHVNVVGGGRAKGICGSGLIDLVAELYLAGAVDPKGRIRDGRKSPRIRQSGDVKGYAVAMADRGEASSDIIIDELDIGNLLRAKGAMYTALTLITERLGVGFGELDSFYVAGSFGAHINPANAIAIGMLPDIPHERFEVLGNSAGQGACLMLLSYGLREDVELIRRKTTYLQLTTDGEFMNRLNAAIFIPHTDRKLFPSVS